MPRSLGRTGRRWRTLCGTLRVPGVRCWLCGKPIDIRHHEDGGPPPRSKFSFSVDHVIPLSRGGDPLDPANARPAHFGCNSRRGDGSRERADRTSRDWLTPR